MRFAKLVALALVLGLVLAAACTFPDIAITEGSGGQGGTTDAGCESRTQCPQGTGDCVEPICELGVCDLLEVPEGARCDDDGGQFCDGDGHCVQCLQPDHCPEPDLECVNLQCVPLGCTNTETDGQETDVDCGGLDCPPCTDGQTCQTATDCTSGFCKDESGELRCAACASSEDCVGLEDHFCELGLGECHPKRLDSVACTSGDQCLSGNCPADDNVCCNSACTGECEACVEHKSGVSTGQCDHVTEWTDPDDECSSVVTCDGEGSCGL